MPGSPGRVPVPIICTRLSTGLRIFPSQAPILPEPEGTRLPEEKDSETPGPWTRRDLVKLGLAAGGAAAAGGLGVGLASTLLKAPAPPVHQPQTTIRYTRFPTDEWWNVLEGQPVKVTDFQVWQGATGVWDGQFTDGKWVIGTGYPVLVIRVKRDDSVFSAPTDVAVPSGFNLYYDDSGLRGSRRRRRASRGHGGRSVVRILLIAALRVIDQ